MEAARQAAFPASQALLCCLSDEVGTRVLHRRRRSKGPLPAREEEQLFDAYFLVHFDRFLRAVDSQQPLEDVLLNDSIHVEPFLTAWYLWGRDLPELDEPTIHLLDSLTVFLRAASMQSAPSARAWEWPPLPGLPTDWRRSLTRSTASLN